MIDMPSPFRRFAPLSLSRMREREGAPQARKGEGLWGVAK